MSNQKRQPAGQPIGGQFAADTRQESAVGLTASWTEAAKMTRLRDRALSAASIARAARGYEMTATTELMKATIRAQFPDATTAEFVRDWDLDEDHLDLDVIRTGDGVVWEGLRDAAAQQWEREVRQYAAAYRDDAPEYLQPVDEPEGRYRYRLDLAPAEETAPGRTSWLDTLDARSLRDLTMEVDDSTGRVMGHVSVDEVEYRLAEEPEFYGFQEDTMGRLEAKYGSRRAALRAVIDSRAWLEMDEDIGDANIDRVGSGIEAAVREALGS